MTNSINVAVVGATGAVGETMISILEQRSFPVGKLFPLASERSAGSTINFKGKSIRVTRLDEFDFSTIEVGFFFSRRKCLCHLRAEGCVVWLRSR